ncbi:MAG: hypothetical protein C4523_05070 [Myxococcales bacterium]|nr:MAG: hypothetical protein C4523_05070 [Myxococcales bacterium]
MPKGKAAKEVTITGFVTELEDEEGIFITTDEDEYMVKPDAIGKRLARFGDQEVEATGVVTRDEDGNNVIQVLDFDVIDLGGEEDEEEPGLREEEEDSLRDDEDEDERY